MQRHPHQNPKCYPHQYLNGILYRNRKKENSYGTTKTSNSQSSLSKNKAGDVTILDFKIYYNIMVIKTVRWASLVVQQLRIHLLMQGTWVRSLVPEGPTCWGAAKPSGHNYWACVLQLLKPACLEPALHNKRSRCDEKPMHRDWRVAPARHNWRQVCMQQWRPSAAKTNKQIWKTTVW